MLEREGPYFCIPRDTSLCGGLERKSVKQLLLPLKHEDGHGPGAVLCSQENTWCDIRGGVLIIMPKEYGTQVGDPKVASIWCNVGCRSGGQRLKFPLAGRDVGMVSLE